MAVFIRDNRQSPTATRLSPYCVLPTCTARSRLTLISKIRLPSSGFAMPCGMKQSHPECGIIVAPDSCPAARCAEKPSNAAPRRTDKMTFAIFIASTLLLAQDSDRYRQRSVLGPVRVVISPAISIRPVRFTIPPIAISSSIETQHFLDGIGNGFLGFLPTAPNHLALILGQRVPRAWLGGAHDSDHRGNEKTNRLLPVLGLSSGVSASAPDATSDDPVLTATYCRPSTAKLTG